VNQQSGQYPYTYAGGDVYQSGATQLPVQAAAVATPSVKPVNKKAALVVVALLAVVGGVVYAKKRRRA